MKKGMLATCVVSLLFFTLAPDFARAEIVDQAFTLHPGWNAVFLEVEPVSTDPADVFSGIPVQSVWRWNPRTSTVEFIQNPDDLVPDEPQWMVYYPGNSVLTNLHAINGETAYLINLGGGSDVPWMVTGQPTVPYINWKANSFNFVGFHLLPGNEPYFVDFFSSSLAHASQEIYVLDNATGSWVQVTSPTVQMKDGEGFWVYCKGSSEFNGPLSVQLEQGAGLHYGRTLVEQNLRVFNHSAADKVVHLTVNSTPPLYLYYWVFNPANNVAEWVEFPTSSNLDLTIPAGETQKLRLGVRRADLVADVSYEDNVFITDGSSWIRLPVSVTGIDYAGLWVGNATITKVSQPKACTDKQVDPNDVNLCPPVATGSEFSFRLILHADDTGAVRLLSQVIQMWQEGTWKPDPNDLGKLIVDEPGHFVLFTDDGLLPNYSGAAMRDGQPVGRRISSPVFPNLTATQGALTGSAAPGGAFEPSVGNDLAMVITLAQDNPTNPFRHMFHPDHKVPAQSYQVVRNVTLTFSDEDSDGRPITGVPSLNWGSSEIGGIYKETVQGIHRDWVHIEGTFLLHKVSSVKTLTTALTGP